VTERDAFGNPIPEPGAPVPVPVTSGDPLVTALPADEQDAPAPPPPPLMAGVTIPTYGPSKRNGGGRLIGLLVTIAFLAPFVIGGWVAYNAFTTAKTVNTVVKGVRDFATSTTGADHGDRRSTEAQPEAPPRGVTGASMLSAANFGRALRSARRDPGGQLGLLRLAPERADLQLSRRGGGLDLLQLRYDGGRSLVRTPGSAGSRTAIIFSKVDRRAPSRLVRQAAKRLGRSTKSIDYVVLIDILGGPRWSAYFKGGAAFQGDAHGRVTRRIQ
jgi:hypothetical protein